MVNKTTVLWLPKLIFFIFISKNFPHLHKPSFIRMYTCLNIHTYECICIGSFIWVLMCTLPILFYVMESKHTIHSVHAQTSCEYINITFSFNFVCFIIWCGSVWLYGWYCTAGGIINIRIYDSLLCVQKLL